MDRSYVSNQNGTVRMFKSDFMEFFSHVHPATPLVLYLPVIGYMLYAAFWKGRLSILTVAVLFLFGVLVWTVLEYMIHRYRISLRTEKPFRKTTALHCAWRSS